MWLPYMADTGSTSPRGPARQPGMVYDVWDMEYDDDNTQYSILCCIYTHLNTITPTRDGPAHLDQIASVCRRYPYIPIITNGNVRVHTDLHANMQETDAYGIMVAEVSMACMEYVYKVLCLRCMVHGAWCML